MDQDYLEDEQPRTQARYKQDDPDEYVKCPYFPGHELRRSRMPYHIMKCQNNPKAPKLLACPFNYMHRVRPEDQEKHLLNCEDNLNRRYIGIKPAPSFGRTVKSQPRSPAPHTPADSEPVPPETGETEWW